MSQAGGGSPQAPSGAAGAAFVLCGRWAGGPTLPAQAGIGRGPLRVDPREHGRGEAQKRLGVGKDPGDAGAPLQLLLDRPLHAVGGAHRPPVAFGQIEDREALRDACLEPVGEAGMAAARGRRQPCEGGLRRGAIRRVPHPPQRGADAAPDPQAGGVPGGAAGEVELAALPRGAGQGRLAGGPQPGMVVRGDELDPAHAAPGEALEKAPPMRLGLGFGDGDAEDAPPPVLADADGRKHGGAADAPAHAHLFVAGVDLQVAHPPERAAAPRFERFVEQLRGAADLAGGQPLHPHSAQQAPDPAGGDAADVHLRGRVHEVAVAAPPALERGRVERRVAVSGGLGHSEAQRAHDGVDALGLVAVGVAAPGRAALAAPRPDELLALDLHGHVEDLLERGAHRLGSAGDQVACGRLDGGAGCGVHVGSPLLVGLLPGCGGARRRLGAGPRRPGGAGRPCAHDAGSAGAGRSRPR